MHDAWEGGERHGVAWRRLILAAGLVAVLVLSWTALQPRDGLTIQTDRNPVATVSDEPDVVLEPPSRAGDRWLCPNEHPVRAFADGMFYPPEHPTVPDFQRRPQGCFLSSEWAESRGYELAPTPANAVRVGPLYLVPAVAPSTEACSAVATIVEFAVPCPSQLPAPGRASSCTNSCLFYGDAAEPGVVIEQRIMLLPTTWCTDCDDHIVITAVKDRSPPELITCGPEMAAAAAAGERIAGYHDCPPGPGWLPGIAGFPHERHTLLVWHEGPVTYAVSMEGHSAQIRALLSALRRGIVLTGHGAH